MTDVLLDVAGGVRGRLDLPAPAAATGLGVLLVPPLGWEEQSSYRPRRTWAGRLAQAGHGALRIDLPGTGDSAGGPRDPDRVGAWVAAVTAATAWLRDVAGARRVAVLALAGGGHLALQAIRDGAAVDDLVLWGTAADGRRTVRELQAFARLESSQTGEDPDAVPAGELHVGGYVLTAETTAALQALPRPAAGDRVPARVLLLGRDGTGPAALLAEGLTAAGADVRTDPGTGWGDLVATPQQAALHPASAVVDAFLAEAAPGGGLVTPPPAPPLRGDGWTETVVAFDTGGVVVRGVRTDPADAAPGAPVALLLNAGALHHAGPNRMWVEAARRWAGRGVPCVRLDLEGIGDADGGPQPYADDLSLYAPELSAQVRTVLDELAAAGATRFALGGLCSGAYWSLHAALEDPRVRSVVLLNPRLLFWQADAGARYELFRALAVLRPGGLRRLREAEAPWRRLLELVVALPGMLARRLRAGRGGSQDALSEALAQLRRHGQAVTMAFSQGDEPLRDELERTARWAEIDAAGVQRRTLPLTGHTLKGLEAQAAGHAVLDVLVSG